MTGRRQPGGRPFRLTAAEILYTQPGRPHLLERFVWQDYDRAPDYPELRRFLRFWSAHAAIDLHSVRVADLEEARPAAYVASSDAIH